MSSEATHYVRRHVRGITLVERAVLLTVADRCSALGETPRGRGPSHATLAVELETSERTMRRWIDSLVEKKTLIVPGRCTFEIPGVADHEPATCGHIECMKATKPNRPDMAGKDGRRTGQKWPINGSDVAAKTFSPTERDRAGRAQGSAQRSSGHFTHPFVDAGHGSCAHCGLPATNSRHTPRSTDENRRQDPPTLHADLRGGEASGALPAAEQPRPENGSDSGASGEPTQARSGGEDPPHHGDSPSPNGRAEAVQLLDLPGGRVLSFTPRTAAPA